MRVRPRVALAVLLVPAVALLPVTPRVHAAPTAQTAPAPATPGGAPPAGPVTPGADAPAGLLTPGADAPPAAEGTLSTVATRHFTIRHDLAAEPAAVDIASFADAVFEGLISATGVTLAEPITIRLYATRADLIAAQPMAAEVDGVLVTSPRAMREIALVASEGDLRAGLRHGLGLLVATEVGAGAVPDLWAIGFADFLAGPGPSTAASVARLRAARDLGALHPWSDLALPAGAFLDPPVSYPLAASAVHFLASRGGLPALMDYLAQLGEDRSWQAALASSFDMPSAELEAEWRSALDDYLDGGWRRHPLYPDAAPPAGADPSAFATSAAGAAAFGGVDNAALGTALGALGARTAALISSGELLVQAAAALDDGRYQGALDLAKGARAAAPDEPGSPQVRAADEMARRARMGLGAEADLVYAESAPIWAAPVAVIRAVRARSALAAIGNDTAAGRASAVRSRWASLLAAAGLSLVLAGSGALGHAAWRARHQTERASGTLRS